jgi:hypothetical protein
MTPGEGCIKIGPIPKDTPVNLLFNLDLLGEDLDAVGQKEHSKKVFDPLWKMQHDLGALPKNATDEHARRQFANLV